MPNKPPPGYSIENVPDFLKTTAAQSKVVVGRPNGSDIASVSSNTPQTVEVNERARFGQPDLNHEETHVFQFSRNPSVVQHMESIPIARSPNDPEKSYSYGGVEGLLAAQKQRKTIANFNMEQQAEMVKHYVSESTEAIAKGDAAGLDKLNRAYGPFLNQLANLPGKNDSMTTMTQKDLTPAAPGLPPAMETGILEPLRVIGGKSRELKHPPRLPKGYTLEQ